MKEGLHLSPEKNNQDNQQEEVINRRAAMKKIGAFMLGTAAAGILSDQTEALALKNKEQIEARILQPEDVVVEKGAEVQPEEIKAFLDFLNSLSREYPEAFANLERVYVFSPSPEEPQLIWGMAWKSIRINKDVFRINSRLFKAPEVLKVVTAHEFGHLVYNNILSPEQKEKFYKLFLQADAGKDQRKALQWFLDRNYVDGRAIGHNGRSLVPNQSELFPMAFVVKKLYEHEFRELQKQGSKRDQDFAEKILKFIPAPQR